jgi:hypothetical protein
VKETLERKFEPEIPGKERVLKVDTKEDALAFIKEYGKAVTGKKDFEMSMPLEGLKEGGPMDCKGKIIGY